MRSQYDITAKKLLPEKLTDSQKAVNKLYDNLLTKDYHNTICFDAEPTNQDVIDVLKVLMPTHEFIKESVTVKFIRELTEKELI